MQLVRVIMDHLKTDGHTLFDVVPALLTTAHVALIKQNPQAVLAIALLTELRFELAAIGKHGSRIYTFALYWNDDDMRRRQPRRQHQTIIVTVSHDQGAN